MVINIRAKLVAISEEDDHAKLRFVFEGTEIVTPVSKSIAREIALYLFNNFSVAIDTDDEEDAGWLEDTVVSSRRALIRTGPKKSDMDLLHTYDTHGWDKLMKDDLVRLLRKGLVDVRITDEGQKVLDKYRESK